VKLTGVAANEQLKSRPCIGASKTEQHDMNRQRDAMYHAERTSYKQSACMKTQGCNKRRKTYRRGQAPSGRLGRTALENQAMNAYWEAAASSAKKQISKIPAMADSIPPNHPRTQAALLTLEPINHCELPSIEARKRLSGTPFQELSVLPCQPYPHPGTEHSHLDGSAAALGPLFEEVLAEISQKNKGRVANSHGNTKSSSTES